MPGQGACGLAAMAESKSRIRFSRILFSRMYSARYHYFNETGGTKRVASCDHLEKEVPTCTLRTPTAACRDLMNRATSEIAPVSQTVPENSQNLRHFSPAPA